MLCLGDFVCRVAKQIQALHDLEIAHLDLRLDNICYSSNFEPVLIDLDRAKHISIWGPSSVYPGSIMYRHSPKFEGREHDWLQLACIILWVLTSDMQLSYHQQTLDIDHGIVRDKFFLSLYKKGNETTIGLGAMSRTTVPMPCLKSI